MYRIIISLLLSCWAVPALAYIGPGLGAGTIGVILGVLGSILLAIVGIFYYPIKRMLKKNKQSKSEAAGDEGSDTAGEQDGEPEATDGEQKS